MFRTPSGQTGRDAYVFEAASIVNELRELKARWARLQETIETEQPDARIEVAYQVAGEEAGTRIVGLSDSVRALPLQDIDYALGLICLPVIEPARETQSVTIIGPNLRDQSKGSFHVHATGCADIARMAHRDPAYRDADWSMEATCRDAVVLEVYSDMIEHNDCEPIEGYRDDLHFFPCCADLPQS
jgi:hypothetical protein